VAQFDVHRIADHGLVVDCQSDWLIDLRSRIVVPLRAPDEMPLVASRLNPIFIIEDNDLVMATQFLRSVAIHHLSKPVTSLKQHEFEIKTALDMLISGY
jgi:toxin CcdB